MAQAFNPYLPDYEYVSDGEPHVFDGRLYVFGSHDRFGGKKFCMNDYVAWSAPVDDLADWRFEGVIYRKTQDPDNADGKRSMYAPDVAKGPDGRYYLYYGLADQHKVNVAVCDEPAGEYAYLGCVVHTDGIPWGEKDTDFMPFDPGILVDDDGRIHLYAGQGPMNPIHAAGSRRRHSRDSAYHVELEPDMRTIRTGPTRLLPNCADSTGTGFEGHEFFEASSIRKFNGRYYFIYSSIQSHELVYAMSDRPDGGFRYCGTLHSNCDVGLAGPAPKNLMLRPSKQAKAYFGNNHGSIAEIGGRYYIFGHRHTNASMFSRQGVAEEIFMDGDGRFSQAEMTSCGLNGGPLKGLGTYPAAIACNLQSKKGACFSFFTMQTRSHPRLTQEGEDRESNPGQYIANLRDGALVGFKHFAFESDRPTSISVWIRGRARGVLYVYGDEAEVCPAAEIDVDVDGSGWIDVAAPLRVERAKTPLFFVYRGSGALDLLSFTLGTENVLERRIVTKGSADLDGAQSLHDIFRLNRYELDDRFVLRDGETHPFAVVCPGGAYSMVCSFIEGTPIARKLNDQGISVFIVYYRVRGKARYPHPQEDLARAVREIMDRAEEYQVDPENYSVWGSSAGGHLAATFGTTDMGYLHYDLPKPRAIVLSYPVITMDPELTHKDTHDNLLGKKATPEAEVLTSVEGQVAVDYPPTYLWCGDADATVDPDNSRLMAAALKAAGVPHRFEIFPGVDHGVGLGTGTAAEGWIDRAVDFWRGQRR